jgi:hypothetical protein
MRLLHRLPAAIGCSAIGIDSLPAVVFLKVDGFLAVLDYNATIGMLPESMMCISVALDFLPFVTSSKEGMSV